MDSEPGAGSQIEKGAAMVPYVDGEFDEVLEFKNVESIEALLDFASSNLNSSPSRRQAVFSSDTNPITSEPFE